MSLTSYGPKFLGVAALALLLAACETAPTAQTTTGGGGGTTQPQAAAPAAPAQAGIRPGSQQDLVVNVGDRVFFGYDKADLTPAARATLDKQVAWMRQHGAVRLVIEGHCDERGTREYNLALGDRRANAAKDYLVNAGIAASRLSVISYGKERPVATGSDEASWAENRRAVTVVPN